ncbi:MAG TPA: LytTR family DNA-binding domain-containing protein [Prolixibacteraceae bacterium]|nr:LytTR family DNA-binding domain-containing protein [Prolixibacteraceae bacterium]
MMKHKICVLIIDSEPESLKHTQKLLQSNSLVSIVESAKDSDEAILKIINSNPDIVLLEYPVKGNAEKELIKYIQTKLTETTIVFVSMTKEYAANAIRYGVFNYLTKPISMEELELITQTVHQTKQTNIQTRINQIIEKTQEEIRLKFQTTRGYLIVDPQDIICCKADGFCTELCLTNNRIELIYMFLSKLDKILSAYNFLRVSRAYLVNRKYVRKVYPGKNTIILFSDGEEYEIKSSKSHMKKLSNFDTELM